jgi:regulator of protease activity HflC (stomatin/prohibitin superfamily)
VAELVKLVVDLLTMLWPLRRVQPWENGVYIIFGKWVRVVGPGVKLVLPYFTEVHPVSVVPEVYTTPLQSITLRDGRSLNFSASVTVVVRDAKAAYTRVGHWAETVVELAAAVLAAELADVEVDRLDPKRGKRDRVLSELQAAINDATAPFGLEVLSLRMSNFAIGLRTIRLMLDRAVLNS